MSYTATPVLGRRKERPYLVVRVRLSEMARWKRRNKRAPNEMPDHSPMFAAIIPSTITIGDGNPPPAIQEVIDAVKRLSPRRQDVIRLFYEESYTHKQLAFALDVHLSRTYALVDATVAEVARYLSADIETSTVYNVEMAG